ncbi:hypothetical protein [Nonomuraea jiangxiensis]|uniref:Uncharacterized protein n=1 Tax=Nonomuraea jiangxiensis TaxID=633440 RepID=A0A1G9PTQ5_9ACTN|nr:hypothetical protein [Nonomuraea jiangxiensis]SDM02172.1 hypothetical protein SAMN05421869_134100 [Nonomuraea jiangxiensis]
MAGSGDTALPAGDGAVVHYYFPVEVEVVGDANDALVQRVVSEVFAELDRELASRQ